MLYRGSEPEAITNTHSHLTGYHSPAKGGIIRGASSMGDMAGMGKNCGDFAGRCFLGLISHCGL